MNKLTKVRVKSHDFTTARACLEWVRWAVVVETEWHVCVGADAYCSADTLDYSPTNLYTTIHVIAYAQSLISFVNNSSVLSYPSRQA